MILIVGAFLGFFVLMPAVTFVHEFGHAAFPLLMGKSVKIVMGDSNSVWHFSLQNLEVNSSIFPFHRGHCYWENFDSVWLQIMTLSAGPLTSLASAAVFYWLVKLGPNIEVVEFCGRFCLWLCLIQFCMTSIPWRYPSFFLGYAAQPSDGYQMFRLLYGV